MTRAAGCAERGEYKSDFVVRVQRKGNDPALGHRRRRFEGAAAWIGYTAARLGHGERGRGAVLEVAASTLHRIRTFAAGQREQGRTVAMNQGSLGAPLIAASVVLGISILGGSWLLSRSIDAGSQTLGQLAQTLSDLPSGAAEPSPGAAVRGPARPDPERRYQISLAGAPTKGPANAPVSIVEWSDFQ
jgi:hypothetical protein